MAVTYIGGASYASPGSSEQFTSLSLPGTAQAGDVGILLVTGQNTGTHAVVGWTQVGAVQDDASARFTVWRRTLTGAGGAVSVDSGVIQRFTVVLGVYRGVDSTTDDGVLGVNFLAEPDTDSTHASPSVAVTANAVGIALYGERTANPSTTFTPPASYTLRQAGYGQQTTGTPSSGLADNLVSSNTSVGGGTWTGNAAAANAVASVVALAVAADSAPVGPKIKVAGTYIQSGEHKVNVNGTYI